MKKIISTFFLEKAIIAVQDMQIVPHFHQITLVPDIDGSKLSRSSNFSTSNFVFKEKKKF